MPSALLRGSTWYAKFRDERGRTTRQRTTCTTKKACTALAHELEVSAERRRNGLAPLVLGQSPTLGELLQWWLGNRCPPKSVKRDTDRLRLHVLAHPIAGEQLASLTAGTLEDHLRKIERGGLGPASVNHVRKNIRTAFNKARKATFWTGPNVAADTEARKVPKRIYDTLTDGELELVLRFTPPQWRGFFAAAFFQGLRKGECAGMRKTDVDLQRWLLTVRASYDNDTTKGSHADVLPIPEPMRPFIEAGMRGRGAYLFPDLKGKMRTEEADPQKVLRAAMNAAGLVQGYDHTCRRKACRAAAGPHVERHADLAPRDCPRCSMRLWPRAIPRTVRFHDLRHSCATHLLRAGIDAHRVQKFLRHSSIVTTTTTYAHLLAEDLRGAAATFAPAPGRAGSNLGPSTAAVGQRPAKGSHEASVVSGKMRVRPEGFEPPTHGFEGAAPTFAVLHQGSQTVANAGAAQLLTEPERSVLDPVPQILGPSGVQGPRLVAVGAAPAALLTVREVAEQLHVSAAGVYALCERGELAHARVLNAIRIAPADLAEYLRRAGGIQ